jgi:hypothetical protein
VRKLVRLYIGKHRGASVLPRCGKFGCITQKGGSLKISAETPNRAEILGNFSVLGQIFSLKNFLFHESLLRSRNIIHL